MIDLKNVGHGDKITLEFAVVVDDNEAAKADLEKDVAHEEVGELGGVGLGDGIAENKASKVAHGGHQMRRETFEGDVEVGDTTWFPKIDMNDVKG